MIHQLPLPDRLHSFRRITSQTSPTAVPSSACRRMKAICASVNFDLFMVLPRSAARIADSAKLEVSSQARSTNREAGHHHETAITVDCYCECEWLLAGIDRWQREVLARLRRGFLFLPALMHNPARPGAA